MATSSRPDSTRVCALAVIAALGAVFLIAAPAALGGAPASAPSPPSDLTADEAIALIADEDGVLRFDVAENGTRFAWAGDPKLVDGLPATDALYVTRGYVYPAGTLTSSNGVNEDGSPEFPDKVLGQWSCYGWRLGDASDGSAPWLSTHIFNFGGALGEAMLVTEGYSIDEIDVALARAITGGTGPYADARGLQLETNLGFNASHGGNFRYEVILSEQE